jgi:hypothetical protein
MNCANAAGFLFLGIAMWLSPTVMPGLFQHTAIDGSSTRALWVQVMGCVQALIGTAYLLQSWCGSALEGMRNLGAQRGAVTTGEWEPDTVPQGLIFVDFRARDVAGAARDLALSSFSAAEARLTNLVGRSGEVRQAA